MLNGVSSFNGFDKYPEDGQVAVTIGIEDAKMQAPTKTKTAGR